MNILNIKLVALFFGIIVTTITTAYATDKTDKESAHMQSMHEHMTAMHAQMQAIHAEKDPEKRKQLMQAHRQSMHDGMRMMHSMNHKGRMGMMRGGKHKATKNGDTMSDCMRMEHMGHRMDMMEQMMEQMMLHEDAHRHHAHKQ